MKAIVTTVGQDRVGIIAGVSHYLAKASINILDVSKTIMNGYFTMMMVGVPEDRNFTVEKIQEIIRIIADENLNVRTITIGTSLLDCIDSDSDRVCQKIYSKKTGISALGEIPFFYACSFMWFRTCLMID